MVRRIILFFLVIMLCAPLYAEEGLDMISEGKTVQFDYTLTVDGQVADTSEGKTPLEYVHGAQMIIPGLEKQLEGLKVNDEKIITVLAEEAYGAVDTRAVIEIPKDQLPADLTLQKGLPVQMELENGQPLLGIVEEVKETSVIVNFNHPLAGQDLVFKVKIVSIK
ncbi:MAG: peptidylprolyl isomerase [Candidatus Omnitrophota bacterium]